MPVSLTKGRRKLAAPTRSYVCVKVRVKWLGMDITRAVPAIHDIEKQFWRLLRPTESYFNYPLTCQDTKGLGRTGCLGPDPHTDWFSVWPRYHLCPPLGSALRPHRPLRRPSRWLFQSVNACVPLGKTTLIRPRFTESQSRLFLISWRLRCGNSNCADNLT